MRKGGFYLRGLAIALVTPGSIAADVGLLPGDRVLAVNGEAVRDLIDLRFLETEEKLLLLVDKKEDGPVEYEIEKDFDESLGLDFGADNFKQTIKCANKCLFCFVDQAPPALRPSLYVKDDDYRRSFWDGTFITLTNLTETQLRRIVAQRLSPLYISVHTTNPALRRQMLGNAQAGLVLEQMRRLAAAFITMHTQIVLCPGINDGEELRRTLADLAGLWPAVASVAVVPVGLTRFQQNRTALRPFRREEAGALVRWLTAEQERFIADWGEPFLYAADEFYVLSGLEPPEAARYGAFPQLENGVGLVRLFLDEWAAVAPTLPPRLPERQVTVVTSVSAAGFLRRVVRRLNLISGLTVRLAVVENRFFGGAVTVAGLLTGSDLLEQLQPGSIGDLLIIPKVMLKKDEAIFLDGITLAQLSERLGKPVAATEGPRELVKRCTRPFGKEA